MARREIIDISKFCECVAEFICFDNVSRKAINQNRVRTLAEVFEVANSTVVRWAAGVANPHHFLKKSIMEYIVWHIAERE